ncbi:MAG TPA: alpha-glucan family phosphorylase [Burkholderiaceae bacterium]|nr:alpha-glucan family phosphorylase [Burkholderiaceae bacterium]
MTALLDPFINEPRIAYFSMEIALANEIPTYSGGLGVLAGDTMRSAADLDLPMVGVTLASRAGYFRQEIVEGRQVERPAFWQPQQWAQRLRAKVALQIDAREVWVGAWLYTVKGHRGGAVPVILLDTDLPENEAEDREITHYLYGGDETYRLKQEMVLGIGGVQMLGALGLAIRKYHLNEGHAALLTLELLRRLAYVPQEAGTAGLRYNVPAVRQRCVFTTHTPVEAGHDQFAYELADRLLGSIVDGATLRKLAGEERLNMTRLALNLSEHVNGVARRHAEVSRRMYPGYEVHAVTNGVHPWSWACDSFRRLYNAHLPRWCHEPELLVRADRIPDEAVRQAHAEAKGALLERIGRRGGPALDATLPLLGFARRMTEYKRADLLFSDLDRLRAIAQRQPFQIVLAGKAHPHDAGGKELIERLHGWARELAGAVPVAFLADYDMELARLLVSGVDVWLNLPLRPLEASGTSGMKAALNGVPSLSVPDGWWLEGWIEGVTGWAVGGGVDADNARDAASLYDKLEQQVLPLYYGDRAGWTAVMKGAITHNASFFNSHRMMRRYVVEAYLR